MTNANTTEDKRITPPPVVMIPALGRPSSRSGARTQARRACVCVCVETCSDKDQLPSCRRKLLFCSTVFLSRSQVELPQVESRGRMQRMDAEDGCSGRMHPTAALGFNLAQLRQPQREQRPMKTLLTKSPDKRPSPREQQGAEAKVRGEGEEGWRC